MKPTIGMNNTKMYAPLFPMSCMRLNMREIEGSSSTRQKKEKSAIITMLNVLMTFGEYVKLAISSASKISMMIALPSTPHQNSRLELVPEKSNILIQKSLKPCQIFIKDFFQITEKLYIFVVAMH